MFSGIGRFWNKYGFNILIIASLVFFFVYWFFFRRKKKGTYTPLDSVDNFGGSNYTNYITTSPKPKKRGPPRESKGELKCREVLERILQRPFPKSRPDFMFNSVTGENLELDMFNRELMLACEYNGQQHYKFNAFFHKTKDSFYGQKYRDKMKRESCRKLGIKLIEVPYTVSEGDIESFIKKELRKLGY